MFSDQQVFNVQKEVEHRRVPSNIYLDASTPGKINRRDFGGEFLNKRDERSALVDGFF